MSHALLTADFLALARSTGTWDWRVVYGAGLALVIVLVLTPSIGSLARRIGAVDEPDSRRLNVIPIPRLGGLALFFGVLVPSLAFLDLGSRPLRGILLGAAVATLVGAVDDAHSLAWWQKLAGQVGAASAVCAFGVYVNRFTFPLIGVRQLPVWLGVGLTVLWIVAIMNMVNFLDGLDGLAAGVCGIAALAFCVIALSLDRVEPGILSAIVCGAALGFLRHNFYPARIFMGDSGALLLGFVLAAISVQGLLKTAATVALLFPLLVLAIPILDTSFVVARRIKHGEPVYLPDRSHLHHRFLSVGFSQRRAVLTMYVWCATLALAALATRFIPPRPHGHWRLQPSLEVGAIGLVALAISLYVVYVLEIVKVANPRVRRRERESRPRQRRSA
jgi:UDP-GlcNAc:undecaprenyl-phosphate GlcNAc-1-phosphate transferase